METLLVNIHTHMRTGVGLELVSVMAGRDARREAREAAETGLEAAADLAGTASVEVELPAPPFSIGVHPWQVGHMTNLSAALAEVEQTAANAKGNGCAAIGEIGLDTAVATREADMEAQAAVLMAQLAIAERHARPVVLHCVRAFEQMMETLAAYRLTAVIFHGFIGSAEQAARAVEAGCHLSFGPRSLSSPRTVEALRTVPLDRVFLETDAERVGIAEVYFRVAALLDIPVERLAARIYDNYTAIFGR